MPGIVSPESMVQRAHNNYLIALRMCAEIDTADRIRALKRATATWKYEQHLSTKCKPVEPYLLRKDILNSMIEHGVPPMYLSGGAAMVVHGLKDQTRDIDVWIEDDEFTALHSKVLEPSLQRDPDDGQIFFRIPGSRIDVRLGEAIGGEVSALLGVRVATCQELLAAYTKLNRPKDQIWIKVLLKHLTLTV